MKLLKSKGCCFPFGRGNVKEATMIVEGQGMGFWTRVRLPSIPLDCSEVLVELNPLGSDSRLFHFDILGKNDSSSLNVVFCNKNTRGTYGYKQVFSRSISV